MQQSATVQNLHCCGLCCDAIFLKSKTYTTTTASRNTATIKSRFLKNAVYMLQIHKKTIDKIY